MVKNLAMSRQHLEDRLKELHMESFGWAKHCCGGDIELATEALQESYLKVLEGRAKFSGKSEFKTWFFAVLRYTVLDMMKADKKWIWAENSLLELKQDQAESYAHKPIYDKIGSALSELSEKQHSIVHLVFYQQMTLDQAASAMGISGGSARQHYHRAKLKLKDLLSDG